MIAFSDACCGEEEGDDAQVHVETEHDHRHRHDHHQLVDVVEQSLGKEKRPSTSATPRIEKHHAVITIGDDVEVEVEEGEESKRQQRRMVACPVCTRMVEEATINTHIDSCLAPG